jgi:hypothetical protein
VVSFEIGFDGETPLLPPFLDAVDEVYVYWHVPLSEDPEATQAAMQSSAREALDVLTNLPRLQGLPVVLSVEVLSIDGGAAECAPYPDGSCRPPELFDLGAVVDADLGIDLQEQALAFNAVITEAASRPEIVGFFARRYNPSAALRDRSASVNGKPARDVLWYWYGRITGGP